MKVRTAGLKFKIATNFIWRVGHGVHHRDSTLPPYGWSSHGVNSERLFTPRYGESSIAVYCKVRNTKSCLLEQTRSNLCHVGSVCSFHLVCATRLEEKRGALEQARSTPCPCRFSVFLLTPEKNHGALEQGRSNLCHVASVKVRCVFLLMLEQTRSHRYHVGSVCSSHLVCSKHPVDKRGVLEQARITLCSVGSGSPKFFF